MDYASVVRQRRFSFSGRADSALVFLLVWHQSLKAAHSPVWLLSPGAGAVLCKDPGLLSLGLVC